MSINLPNLIIGGTNKAGTTAVFRYLSDHPQVCGSLVKETGFLLQEYSGDLTKDRTVLSRYFQQISAEQKIFVEATTSYLVNAEIVIPRIKALMEIAPIFLFILRDPVDRLLSYYNFHVNQLNLPKDLEFADFVDLSIAFSRGNKVGDLGFDERHLRALEYGCYGKFLSQYRSDLGQEKVVVKFYDDLQNDPRRFMQSLSKELRIDSSFYGDYTFKRTNATFSAKFAVMHRFALYANSRLERLLRQRPSLKDKLVKLYKTLNMDAEGYSPVSTDVTKKLRDYYKSDIAILNGFGDFVVPTSWTS